MDFIPLHPWNLSPEEAIRLQRELRPLLRHEPLEREPRFVAGCDISYDRGSDVAHAAIVVLDLKTLETVAEAVGMSRLEFPYVPGLLTFREAPALLDAWRALEFRPDVVVFDGQGYAHPRRMGIASHMGLFIGVPSFGCGKSLLTGRLETPLAPHAGSTARLIDSRSSEPLGAAVRTRDGVQPVYVSAGHRIDLASAIQVVQRTLRGYRVPEPTRLAHLLANRLRRDARTAA